MILLEPPETFAGREFLIFDGACGFCTWSVRQLARLGVRVAAIPFQRLRDDDLRTLGITRAACAERVQFVDDRGMIASGADAVNALLRGHALFGPAITLISRTPALLQMERRGYAWVAEHRVAISRMLGTRRYALFPDDAGG
jgi:predicted DCC family thiol-disulfide oxidoreductase YuxK